MWIMMLAASAVAGPTYLDCTLQRANGPLAVELAVDEAGQQATITLPSTGYSARRNAVFTPSEVRITDGPGIWAVDRVNLDFSRVLVIGAKSWSDRGTCKVKPAPARRAF